MNAPERAVQTSQRATVVALAAILLLPALPPLPEGGELGEGPQAIRRPDQGSVGVDATGARPLGPPGGWGTEGARPRRPPFLLNACAAKTKPDYWIRKLKRGDPRTRATAARALGEMRDEAAVPALIQALKDTNPEVRLSVVQALGRIGPKAQGAVPALRGMRADGDLRVREELTRSLENITQQRQR